MRLLGITSLAFGCAALLAAQPTFNALFRTSRIQSKYGTGTTFSIDVDGREYWITAAHILTGAKGKPFGRVAEKVVELQLLNPAGSGLDWVPIKFSVFQPAEDADIVVLVPPSPILPATMMNGNPPAVSSLMLGAPCEFLGYALGGGWRGKFEGNQYFWMPYVKHCTVSGFDSDSHLWILDGINNHGFSGGPVFTGTGNDLKFVAVISGYYLEPTEVIKGGKENLQPDSPKDIVNTNSGFILAYDIQLALDVIKLHPIGPVRSSK